MPRQKAGSHIRGHHEGYVWALWHDIFFPILGGGMTSSAPAPDPKAGVQNEDNISFAG